MLVEQTTEQPKSNRRQRSGDHFQTTRLQRPKRKANQVLAVSNFVFP